MSQQLSDVLQDLRAEQERLVEDLRAEQIPSRPPPPLRARTPAEQAEARRILEAEDRAYCAAHPEVFRRPLRSVS